MVEGEGGIGGGGDGGDKGGWCAFPFLPPLSAAAWSCLAASRAGCGLRAAWSGRGARTNGTGRGATCRRPRLPSLFLPSSLPLSPTASPPPPPWLSLPFPPAPPLLPLAPAGWTEPGVTGPARGGEGGGCGKAGDPGHGVRQSLRLGSPSGVALRAHRRAIPRGEPGEDRVLHDLGRGHTAVTAIAAEDDGHPGLPQRDGLTRPRVLLSTPPASPIPHSHFPAPHPRLPPHPPHPPLSISSFSPPHPSFSPLPTPERATPQNVCGRFRSGILRLPKRWSC